LYVTDSKLTNSLTAGFPCAAARADYGEVEGLLANQLSGLCRDAAWLKSYVVATMMLTKEVMQVTIVINATMRRPFTSTRK